MAENELIVSLRKAVALLPDDLELRLHLARQLMAAGQGGEAAAVAVEILAREPGHAPALELLKGAAGEEAAGPESLPAGSATPADREFDWHAAEEQVRDLAGPRLAESMDDRPLQVWEAEPDAAGGEGDGGPDQADRTE